MRQKILHLRLARPYRGEHDWFFGSIRAIYSVLPEEAVGMRYRELTARMHGRECYEDSRIRLRYAVLHRNPQRGEREDDG